MSAMNDADEQQRRGNRRVGLVLALMALAVFATTVIRQWLSGGGY